MIFLRFRTLTSFTSNVMASWIVTVGCADGTNSIYHERGFNILRCTTITTGHQPSAQWMEQGTLGIQPAMGQSPTPGTYFN